MLAGQKAATGGEILVEGETHDAPAPRPSAWACTACRGAARNACVGACRWPRTWTSAASTAGGTACRSLWLDFRDMARNARAQIARYGIKTASKDAPIASLSGGNVQRSVLARELSGAPEAPDRGQSLLRPRLPGRGRIRSQIVEARATGVRPCC